MDASIRGVEFTQKGGPGTTQKTCDRLGSSVSHRVPCDARAIRFFGLLLASQTGQSLLHETNADFTLGELRAVIFVSLIKYDLGFDSSWGADQR
jgi:hypothetical protein